MDKTVFLFLSYGAFLGALLLGIWFYKRLFFINWLDRFIVAIIPVSIIIFSELFLRNVLAQAFWPINGGRLAPTFALANGYPLYSPPDAGPVLSTIYGPVTALVYLPATFVDTPNQAVLFSSLIATIFFFLPVLWLHIGQNWHKSRSLLFSTFVFLGFSFYVYSSQILTYSAFRVHADAPALGLGSLACGVLFFRKKQNSIGTFFLSATLAVLAVWTKQVMLPMLVALPLYILIADGRRHLIRYVYCLGFSGVVISAIFMAFFNPQHMLFHIIEIPASQPWTHPNKVIALIGAMRKLLKESLIPISIIVFYGCSQFLLTSNPPRKLREWIACNRWLIFFVVGVFMIPTSLAGSVKKGGDINAFSFALYFLTIAVSLLIIRCTVDSTKDSLVSNAVKLFTVILVLGFNIIEIPPPFPTIHRQIANLPKSSMEIAYRYSKKYPETAFFPMHPLSTMMAENKMYHFSHGLFDRKISGFLVEKKHFREYIPKNMRFLVEGNEYSQEFLPNFDKKVEIKELTGFTVYTKNN